MEGVAISQVSYSLGKIANDPLNMKINFSIDFRCLRVAFDWLVFFFFFNTKISIICGIRLLTCFSRFL